MQKTNEYIKDRNGTMFFPKVLLTREEALNIHRYKQVRPGWLKAVIANYDEFAGVFGQKRMMKAAEAYGMLVTKWSEKPNEVLRDVEAFAEGRMDLIDMVFKYCVGHKQCRQFVKDVLEAAGVEADVDGLWKQHKKHARQDTSMALYGVGHTSMRPEVREKYRATNMERYGTGNPMQNTEIKERLRKTTRERFGVDYAFQIKQEENRT